MFAKSVCILLSGKAGVGKTTSANILKNIAMYGNNKGFGADVFSFATGVKQIARDGYGWDGNKDELGRQLLIEVGQTGRHYNENIWASYTFDKIIPSRKEYPFNFVFVDDYRFDNEGKYVDALGLYNVYKVRIEAVNREILKGTPAYNDISENSLECGYTFTGPYMVKNNFYDYVIHNMGDMDNLKLSLQRIFEDICSKQKIW